MVGPSGRFSNSSDPICFRWTRGWGNSHASCKI
jgi:hypothetical protein